jgi:hypothetical protein
MPRVPTLTSPSSRDHAHYKGRFFREIDISHRIIFFYLGARPESFRDFRIDSHRMTPTPINFSRQSLSAKSR